MTEIRIVQTERMGDPRSAGEVDELDPGLASEELVAGSVACVRHMI
jgi:hypothetical protein